MDRTKVEAIVVGGISGSLPLLINLLNVDATSMLADFKLDVFLGYVIRLLLLILLGSFVVWINSETDKRKALQIGIMAPALVIGYINGDVIKDKSKALREANQQLNQNISSKDKKEDTHDMLDIEKRHRLAKWSLVKDATAQAKESGLKGIHNDQSTTQRFLYGLTGSLEDGWFVIVGSHKNKESADAQVEDLRRRGYDARLYPRFRGSEYYGVIIGSFLPLTTARNLKEQAIKDGLPSGTYLWKYQP